MGRAMTPDQLKKSRAAAIAIGAVAIASGLTALWDDPPEVDGEEAIPGDPYNCRCVAFPILDELDGEDAATADDDQEDAA